MRRSMKGGRVSEDDYYAQFEIFERLRKEINDLLSQYGRADSLSGLGDYSAHADFLQSNQVKVSVGNLDLLRPSIVAQLQAVVRKFPGWEIVYTVAVDGHFDDWPDMGLYIRPHEIIDELQRQYFPKEYHNISYADLRY